MKRRYNKSYYIKNRTVISKLFSIILIFGIIGCIFAYARLCVYPTVTKVAESKAQQLMTNNINKATDEVLFRMIDRGYNSYVNITRDNNGDIILIELNILAVNKVIMDMSNICQDYIEDSDITEIGIPLGAFTGSLFLSGVGNDIKMPMRNYGISNTQYLSTFESVGINQTKHTVYIQIDAYMDIIFPLNTQRVTKSSGYVLCENIIVGKVPDVYFNDVNID